jgi:hypothetical protein
LVDQSIAVFRRFRQWRSAENTAIPVGANPSDRPIAVFGEFRQSDLQPPIATPLIVAVRSANVSESFAERTRTMAAVRMEVLADKGGRSMRRRGILNRLQESLGWHVSNRLNSGINMPFLLRR